MGSWDRVASYLLRKRKSKRYTVSLQDLMEDVLRNSLEKAKTAIEGEVETCNDYISGEVYSTVVETFDENKETDGAWYRWRILWVQICTWCAESRDWKSRAKTINGGLNMGTMGGHWDYRWEINLRSLVRHMYFISKNELIRRTCSLDR